MQAVGYKTQSQIYGAFNRTFNQQIICQSTQSMLCEYLELLIINEEQRIRLRLELQNCEHFNPILLFQRLDQSQSGYFSRKNVTDFLIQKDKRAYADDEVKLIFPSNKTAYRKLVKLILNQENNESAPFFNQLKSSEDFVLRKIDTFPYPKLERTFATFLSELISLKKQEEIIKSTIKKQKDLDYRKMFHMISFTQEGITIDNLKRFFSINKILIESERIEDILFKRVFKTKLVDFERFCRLFTKKGNNTIVYSATKTRPTDQRIKQNTLKKSIQRTPSQNKKVQKFTITASKMLEDDPPLLDTSNYSTNFISSDKIINAFVLYMIEQIKLDDELERQRIALSSNKDFYPLLTYQSYLDTESNAAVAPQQIFDFVTSQQDHMYNESSLDPVMNPTLYEVKLFIRYFTDSKSYLSYNDYMRLVTPLNKDFSQLMHDRIQDASSEETKFYKSRVNVSMENARSDLREKMITFLKSVIINTLQNAEIRRTFFKQSKRQGGRVLRYLDYKNPDEGCELSQLIKFMKSKGVEISDKDRLYLENRYSISGGGEMISHEAFESDLAKYRL